MVLQLLEDKVLTVRDVADLLHVHPNTVRMWTNDGCSNAYLTTYHLCFVANRFHTRLGSGGRSTRPLNPLSRYLLFQR